MSDLTEAARALVDACADAERHYGADAVCGQPPALEALYQGRRMYHVLISPNAMGRPAPELVTALMRARDGVYEASTTSAAWYGWRVAVEALVGLVPDRPAARPDGSQVTRSRASGYDGSCCPECGGFSVRRKGTCLACDECPWSGGCG